MPCCVAFGCSIKKNDKTVSPPITLHQFPIDEEESKKWIKAVKRKNWKPSVRSYLCSKHFTQDCFDRSEFYSKLKKGSIPSIFASYPAHLQPKATQERRALKRHAPPENKHSPSKKRLKSMLATYQSDLQEVETKLQEKNAELEVATSSDTISQALNNTKFQMSCCAFGCTNRGTQGFLMKRFPADPERRKLWAIKVKRDNWQPNDSSKLCEVHFAPEMFESHRADGKRMLKPFAVPTIFSYAPLEKVRKPPAKRASPANIHPEPTVKVEEVDFNYEEGTQELEESLRNVASNKNALTDIKIKYLEEEHRVKMDILKIEKENAEIQNETLKIEYEIKKIDLINQRMNIDN